MRQILVPGHLVQGLVLGGLLAVSAACGTPAKALSLNDSSDTYSHVADEKLNAAYARSLASAGESTTGKFYSFNMLGCPPSKEDSASSPKASGPVYIHAVQDRGLPRGSEFPTYVFTSGHDPRKPEFVSKTYAGKRLFLSDVIVCKPDRCLLSAQQGFSDVCLADPFGTPAPDLPGLRDDFWSHLVDWLSF